MTNRGSAPAVLTDVSAIWDTADGRLPGRVVGAFVIGSDSDLQWGGGGDWPPRQFAARKRRWIPGGTLDPHEQGQVWVGIRGPGRGTYHLVGALVKYRVGDENDEVRADLNTWYCYHQSRREYGDQVDAAVAGE